jgi:hypothetical protein
MKQLDEKVAVVKDLQKSVMQDKKGTIGLKKSITKFFSPT